MPSAQVGVARRAVATERLAEQRLPAAGPQLSARRHVVGGHDFPLRALLDRGGPARRDHERGIAAADGLFSTWV